MAKHYGFYTEHHRLGVGDGYPGDALIDAANDAEDLRRERDLLRAEIERLREAADDGTLVFECADCGDRWDEDDLVQVQPDGRMACPSPCHEVDGGGTTFTMLRDLGPISTWPNVSGSKEWALSGSSEVDRG